MMVRKSFRLTFVLVLTLVLLSAGLAPVAADQGDPRVLGPEGQWYGKSYDEWSVSWWQWLYSIPRGESPVFDESGDNCASAQQGPVWFLAGTWALNSGGVGSAQRTCHIPAGKALLVPIVNAEDSPPEDPDPSWNWGDRTALVRQFMDAVTVKTLTLDGQPIDVNKFYLTHGWGEYTLGPDNILGLADGTYPFYSEGYYVLLAPLAKGKHTLELHGQVDGFIKQFGVDFFFDTTVQYTLMVK